ncbi:MAG TPA: hypothetical protein VGK63_10015 [Candidatus Limnocylindrales bacterium]
MERSVTARYASRSGARFVRSHGLDRERRLGLRSFGTFRPAPTSPTVLRRDDIGPLRALRGSWRRPVRDEIARPRLGGPKPVVSIRWTDGRRFGPTRPTSAAPAPWRG